MNLLCARICTNSLRLYANKYADLSALNTSSKAFSQFSTVLGHQSSQSRNVELDFLEYDDDTTKQLTPVVICHGLFGNKLNWRQHSRDINSLSGRKVITYDAVNHGSSGHHNSMSYVDMSTDLVRLLDKLNIEKAILIGHSMGGKTVMATALDHANRIEKLVVVDSIPKETPATREILGYLEAMARIDMSAMTSRKMIENELAKSVPSKSILVFLMSNLRKDGKRFLWRCNLQGIKDNYPHIHAFPDFADDVVYNKSTLFIGGSLSNYITQVEYPSIFRFFPTARVEHIQDAGHWVHAEKPKEFLELVIPFID